MDNQRLFLIIALVFVLFLIWQAWMEEQAAKTPPQAAVTTEPAAPPASTAAPKQDLPSIPAAPAGVPTIKQLDTAQRIQVITDTMVAEIDTTGGDLRRLGLRGYPQSLEDRNQPFVLLGDNPPEIYIAQSGLVASAGAAPDHHARFTPEQTEYRLQDGQDVLNVKLTWQDEAGVRVTKVYTFRRGSFVIDVTQQVENSGAEEWRGSPYWQLQRTPPPSSGGWGTGVYTYTGGVISTPEKAYEKISFSNMAKENLNRRVLGGWLAMIQHYFVAAWVPAQDQTNAFYSKAVEDSRYVLGMVGPQNAVPPGAVGEFHNRLYAGPKVQSLLQQVAPNLQLTVDYGFLTIIAEPLFWLLQKIHSVLGNWGWSIIVLTILIKLAFYKLSETSYKSMANMRRLAPELTRLKERYGDDKQRMNQAMMEMYRKEKINPLGGCLPIVVQIPVFIALYWVLLESVEMRQAPFMFWIQDLSAKDPYFVLPLIMGATMMIQQKLNPPPPDPMQAKVMMFLPVVFTFMFLWFPAGLVLYWVVNNVLSIAQQYVITKRVEAATSKA